MSSPAARVTRALMAAMVAGLVAIVPVSTVMACSCAMATVPESFGFADVVFSGTTTAVEAPPPGDVVSSMDPVHYAFAVDAIYKGDVTDAEIIATTAMDGASCGTSFGIDERWLVFANIADGEIVTGLCSGNVALVDPETEEAALAELPSPGAPDPVAAEPETFEVPVTGVLVGAAALLVIGLSAWAFVIEPRRRVS